MTDDRLTKALKLYTLTLPCTREQLDETRRQLLHTWNPHRYANHANNPRKYMQLVKQGEAMTKEIELAYRLLMQWVETGSDELPTEKKISVVDPT